MADNNNAVAGLISLKKNGEVINVAAEGVEYCLGTVKREPVLGPRGAVGYKESPQAPWIKFKVIDRHGFDARLFFSVADETITAELANGKTIMASNAWYQGDATGNSDTGQFDADFGCLRCEEV
jgi:hypothetical protein